MQAKDYLEDQKWNFGAGGGLKGFNVMSVLEEESGGMPEFQKTKDHLLKGMEVDNNEMFVQHKFEELL